VERNIMGGEAGVLQAHDSPMHYSHGTLRSGAPGLVSPERRRTWYDKLKIILTGVNIGKWGEGGMLGCV